MFYFYDIIEKLPTGTPAAVTTNQWSRWPDSIPRKTSVAQVPFLAFVKADPFPETVTESRWHQPWSTPTLLKRVPFPDQPYPPPQFTPVWSAWTSWPDLVPTRRKPVVDFFSWTFIPPAAQVWFPPNSWPDYLFRKPQPVDTQPLAYNTTQITATVPVMAWTNWPDFAPKKAVSLNYTPLTLVQLAPQVFSPYAPWDDFARRRPVPQDTQRFAWSTFTPVVAVTYVQTNWPDFVYKKPRPLNYEPLTFLQTVRTPFNTLAQWPDFAPLKRKPGLGPHLQNFTARFPGKITGTTVNITMSAFEVNTDAALFAIYVIQSQPAVSAAVSIQEIGTI